MLQAGISHGADSLHLIVHATQAKPRIDVDLKNDGGSSAGSISITDRSEALRLILAFINATAYVGWLRSESEQTMRDIVAAELVAGTSTSGAGT